MSSTSNFFMGTPGKFSQQSTLGQSQQPLYNQLQEAASGGGPGGSFGQAADYYRSLLSDDNSTLQAMINPELRNFRQNIIPQIGEQFAGMGAGALNSSGYRNATLQAGTDLAERIASMRGNLRQQGAQGLTGLGQQGLGQYFANLYQPRTPGFLETIAPAIGSAAGAALGGGASGGISSLLSFLGQIFGNSNGLRDSISSGVAAGPYSQGNAYNPYTGVQ